MDKLAQTRARVIQAGDVVGFINDNHVPFRLPNTLLKRWVRLKKIDGR